MDDFQKALKFILEREGGYSNHPSDLGRATNKGITQARYDEYRQAQGTPAQDVRMISDSEVSDVYSEIWDKAGCNGLPGKLGIVHFDCAVQRGEIKAGKMLQDICGARPVDGIIGPKTIEAIALCNEDNLIYSYIDARMARYVMRTQVDPSQSVFIKGWLNRLERLAKEVNCKWTKPTEI